NDLRLIDSAVDQYAIERNKKTNDPVGTADLTAYVKTVSALYNTGSSLFHTAYGSQTVDQIPRVPSADYNVLSDVAGTGFWSPYGPKKLGDESLGKPEESASGSNYLRAKGAI